MIYDFFNFIINFLIANSLAVGLLFLVYRIGRKEKKPFTLLLRLFLFGAASVAACIGVGTLFDSTIFYDLSYESHLYNFLDAFINAGLVEEFFKFLAAALASFIWSKRFYKYTYDPIMYFAISALAFSMVENTIYVSSGTEGIYRVMATMGHAGFGIIMGYFVSLAFRNTGFKKVIFFIISIIIPVIIHGLWDYLIYLSYIDAPDIFLSLMDVWSNLLMISETIIAIMILVIEAKNNKLFYYVQIEKEPEALTNTNNSLS